MVIGSVKQIVCTIFIRYNSKNSAHKTSIFLIAIVSIAKGINLVNPVG
jgi:hypothetical protein